MKPLIVNEGEPIRDIESLRLVLRCIFTRPERRAAAPERRAAAPELAPMIDGLAETLIGRPDLLTSHASLTEALRATVIDQLKATPDGAELKRLLHAILEHELETADHRAAYVPGGRANPNAVRWPDPTDAEYPRSVYTELPWAKVDTLVDKSTAIGSAGSCFAMEIAHRLQAEGYHYVVTEPNRDSCAAWGPIFNTPAFRQLVERAFGLRTLPRLLWSHEEGLRDPFREEITFRSVEEYEAGYDAHLAAARAALEQVEVFVVTLGLNEVWYLRADGSVFSRNPWKMAASLVERKVLTVEDNVRELQRMLDVWRAHNPTLKLILTVSPVPMLATFRGHEAHVVTATCHAKATLRVAAEQFAAANRDVHYFPAYETVMYCTENPWAPDQRHVSRAAVSKVMRLFDRMFVREEPVPTVTQRRVRFLVEHDPHDPQGLSRALAPWVTTFHPEDDVCLVAWNTRNGASTLDETERAAVEIIEAEGFRADKVSEILILEGTRSERDALLRGAQGVVSVGGGAEADLLDAAREQHLSIVEPGGPALRAAYEDGVERDRFERMLPMLRAVSDAAAAQHPQRQAAAGLIETFAVGYRHFLATGKTPGPSYLAMRHLFALTDGQFNDALLTLYATAHPPYPLPGTAGLLGPGGVPSGPTAGGHGPGSTFGPREIQTIVRDVSETGVHVLPGHLAPAVVNRIMRWARTTRTFPQSPPAPSADPVLYDPDRPASVQHRFADEDMLANADIRSLTTDLSVLSVAQAFLGCKPVVSHLGMWWSTTFLEQPDSYAAQLYHSDMDKPNFIQFFFYLTDVTSERGPHCFVTGSHRGKPLPLRRDGRIPDAEIEAHYGRDAILELTGPPGTVLVANSRGLHKGRALVRDDRLMINLVFSSSLFGAPHTTVRLGPGVDAGFREIVRTHPRTYARFMA